MVQTERLSSVKEAVRSVCDVVRFGPEFCELKMPSMDVLEKANSLVRDAGKDFVLVTPRVSNWGIEQTARLLSFLDGEGETDVVVNDFGVLSILGKCHNLRPHLGRQLIYIPARCPWSEITSGGFLAKRFVSRLFYQTSLNYGPTISFFRELGVNSVDVDGIPRCIPHFRFLVDEGLDVSAHLQLAPVTITRRCHTARFLGEENPNNCSKPCYTKVFLLKHDPLGVELYLHGNVVFRPINLSQEDLEGIRETGVNELVVAMGPATKLRKGQEIDELVRGLLT